MFFQGVIHNVTISPASELMHWWNKMIQHMAKSSTVVTYYKNKQWFSKQHQYHYFDDIKHWSLLIFRDDNLFSFKMFTVRLLFAGTRLWAWLLWISHLSISSITWRKRLKNVIRKTPCKCVVVRFWKVITARIRRMGKVIFSQASVRSHLAGGRGYPIHWRGGYLLPRSGQGGTHPADGGGWGTPFPTRRAVCLLRSRRRTFLFYKVFSRSILPHSSGECSIQLVQQFWIEDLLEGTPTLKKRPTYYLTVFSKTASNWSNFDRGVGEGWRKALADLGGGTRDAPPMSKFFHFHGGFGKNLAK